MFSSTLGSELMRPPVWELKIPWSMPCLPLAIPGGILVHEVLLSTDGELCTWVGLSGSCQVGRAGFRAGRNRVPVCLRDCAEADCCPCAQREQSHPHPCRLPLVCTHTCSAHRAPDRRHSAVGRFGLQFRSS